MAHLKPEQKAEKHRIFESLKGKKGIRNKYALSTYLAKRKAR